MNNINTVFGILILVAFICAVLSTAGRIPLWIAVILLCIIELLRILPLGH